MDFEEIIYRYRSINPKLRIVLGVFLGLGPGIWGYLTIGEALAMKKTEVETQLDVAQKKNIQLRKNIAEIPKLQLSISENETRLKESNKLLPSTYEIDQVLHDISASAQARNVSITTYSPSSKKFPHKDLDYSEYDIFIGAVGSFTDLMTFMDDVTHFDRIIHFRDVTLEKDKIGAGSKGGAKSDTKLNLKSKLIVFRSEKYVSEKK